MEQQQYGPGGAGLGPISWGVLAVLVTLGVATVWIANHPWSGRTLSSVGHRVRLPAKWIGRLDSGGITAAALSVGFVVTTLLALGFTAVLEDVLEGEGIVGIDQPVSRWLAGHRDLWLTDVLRAVTWVGSPVALTGIAIGVSLGLRWCCKAWLPGVFVAAAGLGIGAVIVIAKALVGRDRPPAAFAVIAAHGHSFPSGHATGTAAVLLISCWVVSRWLVTSWVPRVALWTSTATIIALVGFSRLYLGVHYLSDVVAGWLLGAAWAAFVAITGSWRMSARVSSPSTTGKGLP